MLVNLHVKNLAIIDEVEVDFSENMNVLTGETGAGKSIIIGSVNLALGGKFTGDMIRTGADQALVELLFTVDRPEQREALEALGVTVDGEDVLISRKLMQKRSVCRVNGETVTQSLIKKIAGILIDIHGQNEQQSLLHMSKHMEILEGKTCTGIAGIWGTLSQLSEYTGRIGRGTNTGRRASAGNLFFTV